MSLFGYDFPNILIKFSSKREYLEDIAAGKIYMNKSGYFRQLEDTYRGDIFDGKCPISLAPYAGEKFRLGPPEGSLDKGIELPVECITNFVLGFDNDNKIPLFCCSLLSERILEKKTNSIFSLKKPFFEEMRKFGQYCMLFDCNEFLNHINAYIKMRGMDARYGPVAYRDILSAYSIDVLNEPHRDNFARFFNKDISYQWQNEWRLLLYSHLPLIGINDNHYIAEIEPLTWFYIRDIEFLIKNNIEMREIKQ